MCRWMRQWLYYKLTRRRRTLRNQLAVLRFLLFNYRQEALTKTRSVLIGTCTQRNRAQIYPLKLFSDQTALCRSRFPHQLHWESKCLPHVHTIMQTH